MGCCESKSGDTSLSVSTDRKKKGCGNKSKMISPPPMRYTDLNRLSNSEDNLYDEFSDAGSDHDSDFESKKISLRREGYSKAMFNKKIINKVLEYTCQEVKDKFNTYGPFHVKPNEIPEEVSDNKTNIEFIKGIAKISAHEVYCGEWLVNTNLKHGRGIYCYVNKNIYEGFWVNNRIHGKGRMISKNYIYQGDWVRGEATGRGVLIDTKNRTKYKGVFKNFRPHGKCVQELKDKSFYRGNFNNGVKNGYGELRYSNGNVYKGKFKNDGCEGKGRLEYANGNVYEGQFKNNTMHGKGIMKWTDGTTYDGEWRNGKRNGRGKVTHPDGEPYTGTWSNNERCD